MKKLLMAAAAAAVLTLPALAGAQAAPAKSEFCKMAAAQKNPIAWSEHYHCFDAAPAQRVAVRKPARTARAEAKSPYCKMASAQKNLVSWNAYYHCLDR